MGLHLRHEPSVHADRAEADGARSLAALRDRALALPLRRVSELVRFDERAVAEPRPMYGLAFEGLQHYVHVVAGHRRDAPYRESLGMDGDAEYGDGQQVGGAIFGYPGFERLEGARDDG